MGSRIQKRFYLLYETYLYDFYTFSSQNSACIVKMITLDKKLNNLKNQLKNWIMLKKGEFFTNKKFKTACFWFNRQKQKNR